LFQKHKFEKFKDELLLFQASRNKPSSQFLGWETFVNNLKVFSIEGSHTSSVKKKENNMVKTKIIHAGAEILKAYYKRHSKDYYI
jgi:hypothetical protein